MKIVSKLIFTAVSLSIVLVLGLYSEPGPSTVASNPMKSSQQQYERIQPPSLTYVNSK